MCSYAVLAPVPLTGFRSNSKFDQILECSGLKYAQLITTTFRTRHDNVTVVTCAKFRCDRPNILWARALQNFIEFRIRSKYRLWTPGVRPKKYMLASGSRNGLLCWSLSSIDFTNILQDYLTGTGTITQSSNAEEHWYRQTSNISGTSVGNTMVDRSGGVGASPVGAALTTSSFSTKHMASMDWAKTTRRQDEKHLSFGASYIRDFTVGLHKSRGSTKMGYMTTTKQSTRRPCAYFVWYKLTYGSR